MFAGNQINYSPASVTRRRDFFSIEFYWRDDYRRPLKRFRKTFDLNRIKDIEMRAEAAKVMAETVTEALKAGWNPETDTIEGEEAGVFTRARQVRGSERVAELQKSLLQALKDANLSITGATTKDRTISTYNSHYRLFLDYLKGAGVDVATQTPEFTHLDADDYKGHLIEKGFSPKTINTKIDYAAGLFTWLKNKRVISDNPFEGLKRVREPEKDAADALFTLDELKTIKDHLLGVFPELWQYYLFIHYCFMRPDTIMAVKLSDINLKENTVKILPEDHKNSTGTKKQLLEPHLRYLRPYIEQLRDAGVQEDFYLFSKDMKPGDKRKPPTRAAEFWLNHVKKALGINKNAYQGKHTGGTMYIDDNATTEDLRWLQNQMSHSDLQQTSIYVGKRRKIKLDENNSKITEI